MSYTASARVNGEATVLGKLTACVTALAVIGLIAGTIGGVAVALISDNATDGFDNPSASHPYVGLGVAVVLVGALQMLVVMMLSQWTRLQACQASPGSETSQAGSAKRTASFAPAQGASAATPHTSARAEIMSS